MVNCKLFDSTKIPISRFFFFRTNQPQVVLGAHRVQSTESTQVIVTGSKVIVHASWNPNTLTNDIALIQLPQNVQLTSKFFVNVIFKYINFIFFQQMLFKQCLWPLLTQEPMLETRQQPAVGDCLAIVSQIVKIKFFF